MHSFSHPDTDPEVNETEATEATEPVAETQEAVTESAPAIDWEDRYLRLYAEFDNYRKRQARESLERAAQGAQEVAVALLPVLDDLDRALSQDTDNLQDVSVFLAGQQLIHNKLQQSLTRVGLEPIATSAGDVFDTDIHEAITLVPHPEFAGKVVEVLVPGYRMRGKVVRFSQVVVGQ